MKKRKIPVILMVFILIFAAAGIYGGYTLVNRWQGASEAEQVLEKMYKLVPGLGQDTGKSTGHGRDPLVKLSIDGIDVVGCLEIPSIDLIVPVLPEGAERQGFAAVLDGSPVAGKFRIIAAREDVFRKLAVAGPGDKVIFTDVEGVRYEYRVTTQFHLKDWDEADHDLMLCYDTDDKTMFVVGCGVAE
jgi:sortase (surface protein transpeptidase)